MVYLEILWPLHVRYVPMVIRRYQFIGVHRSNMERGNDLAIHNLALLTVQISC